MVLYFIGVYIINRTLHGHLEIRNFSSRVEKVFHLFAELTREIFLNTRRKKFRISTDFQRICHGSHASGHKTNLFLHKDCFVHQHGHCLVKKQ